MPALQPYDRHDHLGRRFSTVGGTGTGTGTGTVNDTEIGRIDGYAHSLGLLRAFTYPYEELTDRIISSILYGFVAWL